MHHPRAVDLRPGLLLRRVVAAEKNGSVLREERRRRIALAAQVIDRQILDPLPAPPPDAESMLVFYITWKPLADDAPMEGWWRITRLNYAAKGK